VTQVLSEQVGQSGLQWDFLVKAGAGIVRGDEIYRQVLDVLPAALYVTDALGRVTYYNEAAALLWGWRPELGTAEWCGSWKLFWPDGRSMAHADCPMAIAVKEKRQVLGMEALAERPDGTRVPFLPFPTPIFDKSGALIGAVNLLVDITDRKRAEQATLQLASIVESSNDAIITKNLNGIITSWNGAATRLFGYTAEEAIGQPVTLLIPKERLDEEPDILRRIRRGERINHYETVRRRKDGSLINISLTVSPLKNAHGTVVGASKIARDISERKRAAELERLLAAEMKHRVKNSLATVQALASQTLRTASAEEKSAFIARLHAIANAHDLMTAETWDRVPLRSAVDQAVEPFRANQAERVVIEGPESIWLNASNSLLLTMALHELGTNALKYGALSNEAGRVEISWKPLAQPDRVMICWRERGGPRVESPEHRGFGSLLIQRAMESGLGKAQLDFHPLGLVCTLDISLHV
jgi:PAS domain S-box-containing protein